MLDIGKKNIVHYAVTDNEAGQRLDNFLLRYAKGVPKSHLYRIIRSGEVRINAKRAEASDRLRLGDLIRIPPLRVAERPEAPPPALEPALPILYEDEAILAINKPAGLAVHGGSGVSFGVIEALRHQRPEARFLELAHRLDRETSGILLIAKKRSALTALHDMFRETGSTERSADKRYLLLVNGRVMEPRRHVRAPLFKYLLDNGERRVRVAPDGKASHTIFQLKRRWSRFSLLEAHLKTGRTHQIRVHAAHLGFPISGDEKYGDFAANRQLAKEGLKRMFLHAAHLHFPHPLTKAPLALNAPLPGVLLNFLNYCDTHDTLDYEEPI